MDDTNNKVNDEKVSKNNLLIEHESKNANIKEDEETDSTTDSTTDDEGDLYNDIGFKKQCNKPVDDDKKVDDDKSEKDYDFIDEEQEKIDGNKQLKDLNKILCDMLKDLLNTFPELLEILTDDLKNIYLNHDKDLDKTRKISEYLKQIFPEKFFDILYQNEDLFKTKIELLPGIDFHILWNENITDLTRETLWKYLQLLLFNIVPSLSGDSFGDTTKLFEAINEDVFKEKLEETINGMQDMFNVNKENMDNREDKEDKEDDEKLKDEFDGMEDMFKNFMPNFDKNFDPKDIPDAQSIHDHVNNMMGGKLGTLAKDIAEETAKDMNIEMDDESSVNDVFHKLFKNPAKLMDLIKNVGGKLDEKLKSGDIKESELLEEANEFVNKMKNMPGMGNMQKLFNQMGMGKMGGKNGKVNLSAMQSHIQNKMGSARRLDRMRDKLAKRQETSKLDSSLKLKEVNNGIENLVYSTGESYEKSLKPDINIVDTIKEPKEKKPSTNTGKKKKEKEKVKMKLKYL